MYDAVDDPYTYENSTVLVNKLDLRSQTELDDFEAEISSARAREPLPAGDLGLSALLRGPPSPVPGCLRMGRQAADRSNRETGKSVLLPGKY